MAQPRYDCRSKLLASPTPSPEIDVHPTSRFAVGPTFWSLFVGPTLLLLSVGLPAIVAAGCATPNRYESADIEQTALFKRVGLPITGPFKISQGAFGKASHNDAGNEYHWDFDVPFGTPVVAVEDGQVMEVWESGKGGGCDPRYKAEMHNVRVEHADRTVAQYGHVHGTVKIGQRVKKGQVIGETQMSGWICRPQLHFGVYRSMSQLFYSEKRETVPLLFEGLDGDSRNGLLKEGYERK